MSISERSEILSGLYKLRSDAGVILTKCQSARALAIGINVQGVQNLLNEVIGELQPDRPENTTKMEFPDSTFI
jgi:hypothetical protein